MPLYLPLPPKLACLIPTDTESLVSDTCSHSNQWQVKRKQWISDKKKEPSLEHLKSITPQYTEPITSIARFQATYPLPAHLWRRWKDGIRLWPTVKYSKSNPFPVEPPIHAFIMDCLKRPKSVTRNTAGPFRTNMFYLVDDNQTKLRPIFDYSHLTRHLQEPCFYLPSIYQILKYVKLDFSQAFFNFDSPLCLPTTPTTNQIPGP